MAFLDTIANHPLITSLVLLTALAAIAGAVRK